MEKWYIIYVLSKRENKINNFLINKGLKAFIPKRDNIYRRNGKSFIVRKPIFSNYIFVKSELDQNLFVGLVNSIKEEVDGLIRVLTYDNDGTPVLSDKERKLFDQLFNEDMVVLPSFGYIEDQKVIITDGPLRGLESKIVAVNKHKCYVKLAIDLFERETIVEVPLNIVAKISSF